MTERSPDAAPVESPYHVHPTRMRDISDADLAAAIGCPGAGVGVGAMRARLAGRTGNRPVWDPAAQARALTPAARESELAAARELLDRRVDFVAAEAGRSGLYGLHYLRWLRPLVLAYELTGDESFPACFDRVFTDWYASRDLVVGDWPGLDVVWYSLGVWARATTIVPALAGFATATGLTDETWAAMLKTIVGGARWSAEEHAEFRHGNWQLVCAAELLHVAAYLPEAGEASGWAATGRTRVLEHLELDFYDDGGHYERSPGYHELCLEALQRAAVIAEQRLGWRLSDHPRFRAAHDWLAAMATPDGWVPAWQDSTTVHPARLLLRGHYFHADPAVRSLVSRWLSDAQIRAELAVLPTRPGRGDPIADFTGSASADLGEEHAGSRLLADSGYVVFRGPAPAGAFMSINVGPYVEHELESHSHLAVTDFVMSAYGAPLALEAGGPPTYDDPLYQDWYRAPLAHNAMTLPGRRMRTDRRCTVDLYAEAGPVSVLHTHHHGYDQRVDRRIVFVAEPAYWLISDRAGDGVPATWSILGPSPWLPDESGFRSAGAPCAHVVLADQDLEVTLDTGPGQLPDGAGSRYGELHALRLGTTRGQFDVLLAPSRDGDARWRLQPVVGGWQVTDGTIVDTVLADRWERRSADGDVIATAVWAGHGSEIGSDREQRS